MSEKNKAVISAIVILIVEVAGLFGVTVDEQLWTTIVGLIFMLAGIVWGVWHNHNFTNFAGMCEQLLVAMKEGNEEVISQVASIVRKLNEKNAE